MELNLFSLSFVYPIIAIMIGFILIIVGLKVASIFFKWIFWIAAIIALIIAIGMIFL